MAAYLVDVEQPRELRSVVRVALRVTGPGGREEDGFDGAGEGSVVEGGVAVEHGGGWVGRTIKRMEGVGGWGLWRGGRVLVVVEDGRAGVLAIGGGDEWDEWDVNGQVVALHCG